jgi:hypothetical protein
MKKIFMLSLVLVFLSGCAASNSSTLKFALAGAGTGAIAGAAAANPDTGDDRGSMILGTALIGGLIGLVIGGVIDLTKD